MVCIQLIYQTGWFWHNNSVKNIGCSESWGIPVKIVKSMLIECIFHYAFMQFYFCDRYPSASKFYKIFVIMTRHFFSSKVYILILKIPGWIKPPLLQSVVLIQNFLLLLSLFLLMSVTVESCMHVQEKRLAALKIKEHRKRYYGYVVKILASFCCPLPPTRKCCFL